MKIEDINRKYMYRHRMTIQRESEGENEDHTVKTSLSVVDADIPCLLSQKDLDKPDAGEDVIPVVVTCKLFCVPGVDLHSGDRVVVGGNTYIAGEAVRYPHHLETLLKKKDLS